MQQFFSWIGGKFLDGLKALRPFFAQLIEDFKESNRAFKQKVGWIVSYVLVSLVTLMVFIPPSELNEIDAQVRLKVTPTSTLGGRYFNVANESSSAWQDVLLTINNTFEYRWPKLLPRSSKSFYFKDFKDKRGKVPAQNILAPKLRIDCSEGSFEHVFDKEQ